jgi:hypothetical protein
MKNTENFKDPNQLDLFAGIVLTVEQQSQVDRNVDNINQSTNWQRNKVQQLEQLLVEAGFKKGIDFENTFKSSLETRNIKIGYGSGQFETEVTAEFHSGDVVLKGLRFVNNELIKATFNIDIDRDKVQCSQFKANIVISNQKHYLKNLINTMNVKKIV